MLHLVSLSPIETAIFARLQAGDDIVFLENAVLRLLKTGETNHALSELLKTHQLYAMTDALAVRGISAKELVQGITIIDYPELVALTIKHPVIQSWV
jgi:tRNA 2-thiouridine synthesizing protein B